MNYSIVDNSKYTEDDYRRDIGLGHITYTRPVPFEYRLTWSTNNGK